MMAVPENFLSIFCCCQFDNNLVIVYSKINQNEKNENVEVTCRKCESPLLGFCRAGYSYHLHTPRAWDKMVYP